MHKCPKASVILLIMYIVTTPICIKGLEELRILVDLSYIANELKQHTSGFFLLSFMYRRSRGAQAYG